MRFLVDAQLPRSLADLLISFGHDAMHTLDLPQENRTSDETLCQLALHELRMLVTKDEDFVDSHFVRGLPPRLLYVTTGNISNRELLALFRDNLSAILQAADKHFFIEIDRSGLTIHG